MRIKRRLPAYLQTRGRHSQQISAAVQRLVTTACLLHAALRASRKLIFICSVHIAHILSVFRQIVDMQVSPYIQWRN